MEDVLYSLHENSILVPFHNGTEHNRLPAQFFTAIADDNQNHTIPSESDVNDYRLDFDPARVSHFIEQHEAKNYVKVDTTKLRWTPFLLARQNTLITSTDALATEAFSTSLSDIPEASKE